MTDVYVGIDQSYSGFGLVEFHSPDNPMKGLAHLKKFDGKNLGPGITRLVAIEKWLDETFMDIRGRHHTPHVVMEGYAAGAKFGREKAGELGHTVKRVLYTYNVYPTIVAPTALKKFVLGKGSGGKNEMLLGVYRRWGVEFDNDNLADAYALSRLAYLLEHPDEVEFKYEQEVIKALTYETERWPRPA